MNCCTNSVEKLPSSRVPRTCKERCRFAHYISLFSYENSLQSQSSSNNQQVSSALASVQESQLLAQLKLDLIRMALDKHSQQLPSDSPKRQLPQSVCYFSSLLALEVRLQISVDNMSPPPGSPPGGQHSIDDPRIMVPRPGAGVPTPATRRAAQALSVTGRLEVVACLFLPKP